MERLISNAAKFSPQHIFNLGQLDILSRFDSFGDIPGHGEIFLDRKILWSLKTNLVLFGMSFIVLYIKCILKVNGQRCQWTFRQLSVTFPDCSESIFQQPKTIIFATGPFGATRGK